ncbi:pyridoxal-phosphate dependent enzyme [Bradyrhizobium diazoefficiens]|uniref:pyridoxal-phosphate dependent enzyme n=1 Tax=Bradyrhizobium diazoefficiens TaxID=1355477 RepID=UPI00190E0EDD|nr:pyridoxal-phosphate dependent enzyme [Bradyrhizobium diazoefficiens]QQO34255.1 pyridoxal-phosphate dependent enzyme [Bradyrhizobium diazoefficiens]
MKGKPTINEMTVERYELPDAAACYAARDRLNSHVLRTPVRELPWLSQRLGRLVVVKLEHLQRSGSFKFRGALNALLSTPREQTVITGSAGNHSLALAEAALVTGHRIVVCLPLTASPLKRERLANYGVAVIECGATLDGAIEHARTVARQHGFSFISPYNDAAVISGAATIALDLVDQVPGLEAVIAPVGGGGLVTGLALGLAAAGRDAQFVGVQPARFAGLAWAIEGRTDPLPYRPTLADGLMVNPDPDCPTIGFARERVDELVQLDEETIAAGCLALLARESLLCEPSGAIGIAAALAGRLDGLAGNGPLVIVLSGGNLALATLAKILAYPFRRPEFQALLELRHRTAEEETRLVPLGGLAQRDGNFDWDRKATSALARDALDRGVRQLKQFLEVCDADRLPIGEREVAFLHTLSHATDGLLSDIMERTSDAIARERMTRLAGRAAAFIDQALAWQAPAYDQAGVAAFSMPESQQSPLVNYTRYGSRNVMELERDLTAALGFDLNRCTILATSSGMAAYTLVEAYLLRHVLEPGDSVVCQPGLYFETLEQLSSNRAICVEVAKDDAAGSLIDAVRRCKARAVFVEPLTNTPDLRVLDLRDLLRRLDTVDDGPLLVVVDGTLLSGAFDPFDVAAGLRRIEVIYTESGSKYLQAGLDLTTLGLVAARPDRRAVFERLRRNTGTILYDSGAVLTPRLTRAMHLGRMRLMTANAMTICGCLEERFGDRRASEISTVFPGKYDHPDWLSGRGYAHLGGVMTLRFAADGLNNRWMLDAAIEHVLAAATDRGVPITKGVSFGFSVPRISAAWSMSERSQPFLRLSVGDGDRAATETFAEVLVEGISRFLQMNRQLAAE